MDSLHYHSIDSSNEIVSFVIVNHLHLVHLLARFGICVYDDLSNCIKFLLTAISPLQKQTEVISSSFSLFVFLFLVLSDDLFYISFILLTDEIIRWHHIRSWV